MSLITKIMANLIKILVFYQCNNEHIVAITVISNTPFVCVSMHSALNFYWILHTNLSDTNNMDATIYTQHS